jgi:hypothetical protein
MESLPRYYYHHYEDLQTHTQHNGHKTPNPAENLMERDSYPKQRE